MAQQAYAQAFQAGDAGTAWDKVVYSRASYDTFIWELQQPRLLSVARHVAAASPGARMLDFACGTGRVLAAIEPFAQEAVGLDISPAMLAAARSKVQRATVLCGNILDSPDLLGADFDMITAFRFFLNTEPSLRLPIMKALAQRLRGPESRLVFNVHGNTSSVLGLYRVARPLAKNRNARTMSYTETKRLAEDAGLKVEACYGYGLTPRRLYSTPLGPLLRRIDTWAASQQPLARLTRDLLFICRPC